ncbi:hypothetical protein BGX28_004153 [Mortierella sp. GBA30]|nr:hypothetical protein BGX28_004153 [Mortierella sp. GBA30]
MSTYQTDLLFVQESRLPIVFTTLSKNGLHIVCEEEPSPTPETPIPSDKHHFQKYDIHDIQEEGHSKEFCGGDDDDNCAPHRHQIKHPSKLALATPPGSQGSSSEDERDDNEEDEVDDFLKQARPLDILSPQRRDKRTAPWSESFAGNEHIQKGMQQGMASPTTATTFELRQQAIRTLPENSLRCVGLNTELETGHQPWILKVIKILFYHDKVKEAAIRSGRQPPHEAPRFFSFTATSECVSMITDTYILEEFEEHELFMDMDTCPLRLIQLDLHRFGLDKYGIIHSVARPLTEAGIDLLYLSTFSTANILVAEHRLSEAERILSGSGASTPRDVVVSDNEVERRS